MPRFFESDEAAGRPSLGVLPFVKLPLASAPIGSERVELASMDLPAPAEVAMVGDDLWSDVQGAQRAGLEGWLVRTGKFREEALRDSGITPDRVLASVAALAGS